MGSAIRVLIVDDHASVRQALRYTLEFEPDLEIVGEASDGTEAVRLAQQIQPDVVLMDTRMPQVDGLEATRKIVQSCPKVRVVGLSMYSDDSTVREMLQAGAAGYVQKPAPLGTLIAVIRGNSEADREK